MTSREVIRNDLAAVIREMGYPEEFGYLIADELSTEKYMLRMIQYLRNASSASMEEIADEMLSMVDERNRWREKKENEYYNEKFNNMIYRGLFDEEDY